MIEAEPLVLIVETWVQQKQTQKQQDIEDNQIIKLNMCLARAEQTGRTKWHINCVFCDRYCTKNKFIFSTQSNFIGNNVNATNEMWFDKSICDF